MKLYFMKKEALEILKSNLEITYNLYYTEATNDWLRNVCNGNPFVEFKEIPDFELTPIDEKKSIGEIEFNNCKILYKNLAFLSESQACDERLWAGLCHSVYYEYLRKRWGYDKNAPKSSKEAISTIKSRFFFSGGTRSGLYRNSLAKCWWVGHNTYSKNNANPFEMLDIIGSNSISSKISDIFYNNNFSANPVILAGIVEGIKNFRDEDIKLNFVEHIRPTLQYLNAVGGNIILDCLSKEEISEIIVDHIYGIIQGDECSVEMRVDNPELEAVDETVQLIDVSDETDYICLGDKVLVTDLNVDKDKTIIIDYLKETSQLPPLVKLLLGKKEDTLVDFKDTTYLIKRIMKANTIVSETSEIYKTESVNNNFETKIQEDDDNKPSTDILNNMITQDEFVRRVDAQEETIERYIREKKLIPDLIVPIDGRKSLKYFNNESVEKYARENGWRLIDDSNRKGIFLEMIHRMDMSYSYKPVLIKAILAYADEEGCVKLDDIVDYFRTFYENRRANGLLVEKKNSIFAKGEYTDKKAKQIILANPFRRFETMQMLHHTKALGIIQVDEAVWKHLTEEEKKEIEKICDNKLKDYYERLVSKF